MSWTLDIIIVLIAVLTLYFAAKNGFVKTAISAFSFIIAVGLTAAFASPVADFIKQSPVADTITNATEERITDILLEESCEIEQLLKGENSDFNTLLSAARLDKEEISQWYSQNIADSESASSQLAEKIATPIIDTVALVIAIIVIYIASQIALSIVAFVLDKVFRLPVLKSCNKLLGILVGIILAFFRICLFCFVIKILMENSDFLGSGFIEGLQPEKTLLFKSVFNIDIFSFFI